MKKVLSILIAVCLIVSFVPAVSAASNDLTYAFSINSFVIPEENKTSTNVYHMGNVNFGGFELNEGYNAWKLVNVVNSYTSLSIRDPFINWVFSAPKTGPVFTQASEARADLTGALAFEINIPENAGGVYSATLKLRKTTTPKSIEGYLLPKAEFAALADGDVYIDYTDDSDPVNEELNFRRAVLKLSSEDRIGTIKPTYTGKNEYEELAFPINKELSSGAYIFVIVPNGESSIEEASETVCLHSLYLKRQFVNRAESKEYPISAITDYYPTSNTTSVRDPNRSNGRYYAKLRYDNYDAVNYGSGAPYMAFGIEVEKPGRYEVHLKAYENLATSAAPAIYVVHEDDILTGNVAAGRSYGVTRARFVGAYTDDLRSPIGYYDFSKASTTEYSAVKNTAGEAETVIFDRTGKYYIVVSPEAYSRALNPNVRNTRADNEVTNTLTNGYINESGAIANSSVQPANSVYQQDISISGIYLKAVRIADDVASAEKEAEKEAIINEDGGDTKPSGTASTNATVNAIAAYIDGSEISGEVISSSAVEVGKDCSVKASEIEGYKFLYWAKAFDKSRKILSHNSEYTFKPHSGVTSIMAVYESTSAEPRKVAEFYNGNGQLLEKFSGEFEVPQLPTMAGHGRASHWALAGSDDTFVGGETLNTESEMLFVAVYNDPAPVGIVVNKGTGSDTYAYGADVKVTATKREGGNGYNVFNYWEKDGEIVGFGLEYTFKAWEDCVVNAVYKAFEPIAEKLTKIIMKSAADDNVMAEYIGLENAVEKGIIFGGKTLENASYRAVMSGNGNQFVVENDVDLEATGYAILPNGGVIYSR